MAVTHQKIEVRTKGQGTYEFTDELSRLVNKSGISDGMAHAFCRHTSCSLVLMENADPTARHDLEYYLNKLVPENDPGFRHTMEGPDDMPSHIKMALTRTSEAIPVIQGRLALGTWQGLFLWEHRHGSQNRTIILSVQA